MKHLKHPGFTLAELLIALAILGVIATFAIPKILQTQQDAKRKAVFKETLSALSSIVADGWQSGELNDTTNGGYILQHLNIAKLCATDADAQGCWPSSHPMPNPEQNEPGAVMHNGATLGGLNDNAGGWNWVFIDWNGADPPNTEGDDQMKLMLCYDPTGDCGWAWNFSGSIRPLSGFESEDLYDEVFSQ